MLSRSELHQLLEIPLRELGVGEQERNLYILSLSLGPTPISKLAALLGVNRPNMYKLIVKLEERGFAKFSGRRYRKTFVVESPETVRQKLRAHQESLQQIDQKLTRMLPDLLALFQQGELPTSIRIYGLNEAWLQAFSEIAETTKEEFLYFGNVERFSQQITVQEQWKRERIARGIRARVLMFPGSLADELRATDQKDLRTTRSIKGGKMFLPSFQIVGKRTILRQPEAKLAILIDDEYLTEMFRSIFEMLWEISKDKQHS